MSFKNILLLIVTCSLFLHTLCSYTVDQSTKNFWINGHPSENLQSLLTLDGIPAAETLNELVTITQKEWFRTPMVERSELKDTEKYNSNRTEYFKLFDSMHLTTELDPTYSKWDYVFILACKAECMTQRINYALELYKTYHKNMHYFAILTGTRNLVDSEKKYLKDHFQIENVYTELECASALAEKLINNTFKYDIVHHELTTDAIRSNTEDTIQKAIKDYLPRLKIHPLNILLISSQPHGMAQLLTAQKVNLELNANINFEVAANTIPDVKSVKNYLNTIAGILYFYNQIQEFSDTQTIIPSAL